MKDAGAHGADRSKDYLPKLDALETSRRALAQQLEKPGAEAVAPNKDAETPKSASRDSADLPAELLATIRATKIAVADQDANGHGVSARAVPAPDTHGRG
jgi:hypothetical protein